MAQQYFRITQGPSEFDLMLSLSTRNKPPRQFVTFEYIGEDGSKKDETFYIEGLIPGDPSIPTQWKFLATRIEFGSRGFYSKPRESSIAKGVFQTFNRVGLIAFE